MKVHIEVERTAKYWSSACPSCPLKARCTPSNYRRITRREHERVLETMQARLDAKPDAAVIRGLERRTRVWHVEGVDGDDTLPHEDPSSGANRDESGGAGVQHEASDQDHRHPTPDQGDGSLIKRLPAVEGKFPVRETELCGGTKSICLPEFSHGLGRIAPSLLALAENWQSVRCGELD